MTYIIEQKIKGHVYLYEVESYWDPTKKQARQRRKYLGKKDPETQTAITPRKLPTVSSASDFGHLYVLKDIAHRIGLVDSVTQAFPQHQAQAIMDLAYFNVLEGKPLYLYDAWSEGLQGICHLSSQKISQFLQELAAADAPMNYFFQHWGSKQKPLKGAWLDITSVSSYSQHNSWVEWGYNRDNESLPQVNLGVLVGSTLKLPFFYQLYPGSIADVSTLHNIALRAKDFEFDIETWIMDRGFFSTSNLTHLATQSYRFITAMPLTLKETQTILAKSQNALRSPTQSFCLGKDVLFAHEVICIVGELHLRACIYLSEKRRAQEIEAFMRRLDQVEQLAKHAKFNDLEEAREWLSRQWKGCSQFYDIKLTLDHTLILKRRRNALSLRLNRMGKMILVTNDNTLSLQEILEQYRSKDRVEKVYDTLKNSLNEQRLRVHTQETMQAKMFITFIALILHTAITNQLYASKLSQKYTLPEIFMELKKIRLFTRSLNNTSFLSEISKKHREIFNNLNIPIPSSLLTL